VVAVSQASLPLPSFSDDFRSAYTLNNTAEKTKYCPIAGHIWTRFILAPLFRQVKTYGRLGFAPRPACLNLAGLPSHLLLCRLQPDQDGTYCSKRPNGFLDATTVIPRHLADDPCGDVHTEFPTSILSIRGQVMILTGDMMVGNIESLGWIELPLRD
jgi:hypothetical protein